MPSEYESRILADNPKAYYRMKEDSGLIQDSSGLGHHATSQTGTPDYLQRGNKPISSDPADSFLYMAGDYFSIPDHADLDHGDVLSVEAWITKDPEGTPQTRVISGRGSTALTWGVDNNYKVFAAKADVGAIALSSIAIEPGKWYHVAYTKNGATSKIYINGVDVTGTVTNQTLADVAVPLIVGADYNGTVAWLGALDEVAFYNYALTQQQVLAHYIIARASRYRLEVLADSPAAYYPLSDDTFGNVYGAPKDISGNGRDMNSRAGKPLIGQTRLHRGNTSSVRFSPRANIVSQDIYQGPSTGLPQGDVFTYECWAARSSTADSGELGIFIQQGHSGIWLQGHNIMLAWSDHAGISRTVATIVDLLPHHYAVTKNGASWAIYIDGQAQTLSDWGNQTVAGNGGNIRIGSEYSVGQGGGWNGWISDCAVYPTALSAARIAAHYAAGIDKHTAMYYKRMAVAR